jgi:hypothetical protein
LPFEIAVGDYETSFVDRVFEGWFFVDGFNLGVEGVFLYFFVFSPIRDEAPIKWVMICGFSSIMTGVSGKAKPLM